MENKKNKNLGLSIIAIFISILSIFISILNFNGTNKNNNYLLNGQQTHVAVEPIKHNKVVADNKERLQFSDTIYINDRYSFNFNIVSYTNDNVDTFTYTIFDLYLYDNLLEEESMLLDEVYDSFLLDYYNTLIIDIYLMQMDVSNIEFTCYFYINNNPIVYSFIYDIPIDLYNYYLSNNYDLSHIEYNTKQYEFYFAQLFNHNSYNNTLFDNISLIATKVGAILVATLSPITTLLFSNGKLTIVGASLAMALGVGAIYLIFRMVRGLIKQNGRG